MTKPDLISYIDICAALGYSRERLGKTRKFLTEGTHFHKIGSHYFYTESGKKELLRIQKLNRKFRNKG